MIKLDSISPSLTLSTASPPNADRARRLVVLIPGFETDHPQVTHRIWELARTLGYGVLFLGLCSDASEEPGLRRALVTMSALVQDGRIATEVKTEVGNDWVRVVKSNWRECDLIVCYADHRTGLRQKPLGQILESKLKSTVYVLTGPDQPLRRNAGWLSTLLLWGGFAVLVMGFFFIQMNIDTTREGWVHTTVLAITVLVEFWLVWVWNSLFG